VHFVAEQAAGLPPPFAVPVHSGYYNASYIASFMEFSLPGFGAACPISAELLIISHQH